MAADDRWAEYDTGLDGPYRGGEVVVPHASNDLTVVSRAIYVGVTGNVAVVLADGAVLTLVAVQAGTTLRVQAKRINAVNTTATTMVSLY